MTTLTFAPAAKVQLKGRVAICGPTGAGKTWTALGFARTLAGPDGNIAVVDTENRSASYYAPFFRFDVANVRPPYDVRSLIDTIRSLDRAATHQVLVIDSLSHYWEGEGGILDQVDAVKAKGGNQWSDPWSVATPLQRELIDTIRNCGMHVVVCMRSVMLYVPEEYLDRNGIKRTKPTKVGLKPRQREGVEYEFTVMIDMDLETHRAVVTKSRCHEIADAVAEPDRHLDIAEKFARWLDEGAAALTPGDVAAIGDTFAAIPDASRKTLKQVFKECFGLPTRVTEDRLGEVVSFLREALEANNVAPPAAFTALAAHAALLAPDPDDEVEADDPEPVDHVGVDEFGTAEAFADMVAADAERGEAF